MSLCMTFDLKLPARQITDIFIKQYKPLSQMEGRLLGKTIKNNPNLWPNVVHKFGKIDDYNVL